MSKQTKENILFEGKYIKLYNDGFKIDSNYFNFDEVIEAKGEFEYRNSSENYYVTIKLKDGEEFISKGYSDIDSIAIAMVLVSKINGIPLRRFNFYKIWFFSIVFWAILVAINLYLLKEYHNLFALVSIVLTIWFVLLNVVAITQLYQESEAYKIYQKVYKNENRNK